MTTLRAAAQQALEALTPFVRGSWTPGLAVQAAAAMDRLEDALAEPVQEPEPVAWMDPNSGEVCRAHWLESHAPERDVDRFSCPLYTSPPQRPAEPVQEPVQEALTIERLRDALVASRIVPPAAVEDPDEYDDGVTLYRIEALHRRLA